MSLHELKTLLNIRINKYKLELDDLGWDEYLEQTNKGTIMRTKIETYEEVLILLKGLD